MPGRPSLLDNLREDTGHGDALVYLIQDFEQRHELSVATGYVNLGGLHHLAVSVDEKRATRLLVGAAPGAGLGGELPLILFEQTLLALRKERDLARFPESRAVEKLLAIQDWLKRSNVEVRRYVSKFLHGKAYLFGDNNDARAALVTSANLTAAGMWRNLELGLVHYDPEVAKRAVNWFDALWEESDGYKDDLHDLLFPDVSLLDPRTVYLRALLELFGDQPDEDQQPPKAVNLAPFQEDGYRRALSIVNRHGGVVFADGVGTGKTEIGLAFVEEYAVRRGQHVLVVVPAQLRSQWTHRLDESRLPAQVISYHDLAADEQVANQDVTSRRRVLSNDKDAYRLIIFDEAHALRNPGTTWHGAMSRLLGGQEKHLLLLTATPINNGLWDLYHMVFAFARHDHAFAAHGIPSLRQLFLNAGANERDPENLNPDALFRLADMVSVRRARHFIESRYPGATFPDGTPVSFPVPHLAIERYDLDDAYPGLVSELTARIRALRMARYRPSLYRRETDEESREATLSALLQSGILKRLESCWYACLLTINRILASHHAFLEAWDKNNVLEHQTLREAAKTELDETAIAQWLEEKLDQGLATSSVEDFVPAFRDDVEHDRDLLLEIQERLRKLSAERDPKLVLLRRVLENSASKKVAVFSTFADTVAYLHSALPRRIAGRQRVTVIGADTTPDERTRLLSRFCPDTVVRPGYRPTDGEVDLLISNDVLSEGQNLQQAAAVVSYDMPWNPQRMVQRYGRVIRLKSPHRNVYLTTMLPEQGDLEEILRLEIAIRRKIIAARPYGMDVQVIDRADEEIRAYAQRLDDCDPSLLDENDEAGGTHEFSGEALRAELRRELEEGRGDELKSLPWGIGAAFRQCPDTPSSGRPGVFFACRAKGEQFWRYVDETGGVLKEPAPILRRIDPGIAPGVHNPPIDLELAWEKAVASIVEDHNREVLDGSSESLGPIQRWSLELLTDPAITVPSDGAEAYDALSIGRSQPVRVALGKVKRSLEDKELTRSETASRIVNIVKMFGLRGINKAPVKEKITADDVGVVCWMGVLRR